MPETITNNFGLSPAWVQAVTQDTYDRVGDYSVTGLISPVRLQTLLSRHRDKVVEDVTDKIWMLLGSAVHYVLALAKLPGAIIEERFTIEVLGRQISMKPDWVEPLDDAIEGDKPDGYRLRDFKITSLYAVQQGPKEDWISQTNLYAYGLRQRGINVRAIAVEALLKDWSWTDCHIKQTSGYPPAQVIALPVQVWTDKMCLDFLERRVDLFEQAKLTADEQLPECTDSERWATPDCYAVKKKGGNKALPGGARIATRAEAEAFGKAKKFDCEIEFRKGESKRCERYCPCRGFCSQYQQMKDAVPF